MRATTVIATLALTGGILKSEVKHSNQATRPGGAASASSGDPA